MTIASVRIYFRPMTKDREQSLTFSHWGFAEWFIRRLKPIREQLRGSEAKGVNIVNLMLHENPEHAWFPNEWRQRANSFNYSLMYDLGTLENQQPIENIQKLMQLYATLTEQAPWPQVRVLATQLRQPLSEIDKVTLLPYLQWPRGEKISHAQAKKIIKGSLTHLSSGTGENKHL